MPQLTLKKTNAVYLISLVIKTYLSLLMRTALIDEPNVISNINFFARSSKINKTLSTNFGFDPPDTMAKRFVRNNISH